MSLQNAFLHHILRFNILLILLLSSSLCFTSAGSRLVNVTVDDQLGDPTTGSFPDYLPNDGTWHIGSPSEDCPVCTVNPSVLDLSQVYKQTWHDATYRPWESPSASIAVSFNGSAVYVFNIILNALPSAILFTNISFSIDGRDVGRFLHFPDSSANGILYNQPVYHNTTLTDGPHTLNMTASDVESIILFDYLVYTTQSNDPTPANGTSSSIISSESTQPPMSSQPSSIRTPRSVGSIVGGVLGGITLLGVAVGAFFVCRRHTRSRSTTTSIYEVNSGTNGKESVEYQYGVAPSLWTGHVSLSLPPSAATSPSLLGRQSLDRETRQPRVLLASDVSNTHPSPVDVNDVDAPDGSSRWSSKSREELTRRIESLQRSRSALSSQAPSFRRRSRSEVPSDSGAGNAILELEAEISQLRGVLATLNERLAGDGRGEPLPPYAE